MASDANRKSESIAGAFLPRTRPYTPQNARAGVELLPLFLVCCRMPTFSPASGRRLILRQMWASDATRFSQLRKDGAERVLTLETVGTHFVSVPTELELSIAGGGKGGEFITALCVCIYDCRAGACLPPFCCRDDGARAGPERFVYAEKSLDRQGFRC
jgi:hypothetical protein